MTLQKIKTCHVSFGGDKHTVKTWQCSQWKGRGSVTNKRLDGKFSRASTHDHANKIYQIDSSSMHLLSHVGRLIFAPTMINSRGRVGLSRERGCFSKINNAYLEPREQGQICLFLPSNGLKNKQARFSALRIRLGTIYRHGLRVKSSTNNWLHPFQFWWFNLML